MCIFLDEARGGLKTITKEQSRQGTKTSPKEKVQVDKASTETGKVANSPEVVCKTSMQTGKISEQTTSEQSRIEEEGIDKPADDKGETFYFNTGMGCPAPNCKRASKQFLTYWSFSSHWTQVHSTKLMKQYSCIHCHFWCTIKYYRKKHLKTFHPHMSSEQYLSHFRTIVVPKPEYISPTKMKLAPQMTYDVSVYPQLDEELKPADFLSSINRSGGQQEDKDIETDRKESSEKMEVKSAQHQEAITHWEPQKETKITGTEPQKEAKTTGTELQKEAKIIETEPQKEAKTTGTELQKEAKIIGTEPEKEGKTAKTEQKQFETVHNDPLKESEIVLNEQLKEAETAHNEQQKEAETVHNEPQKQVQTVHSEPLKEVETVQNEPQKQVQTVHNEPLKEAVTADTIPQKYILFHFIDGMSCPVPNCSVSRMFVQRDFIEHWKKRHNWGQIQLKEVEITHTGPQNETETIETEPQQDVQTAKTEPKKEAEAAKTGSQKEADIVHKEPQNELEAAETETQKEVEAANTEPQNELEAAETETQNEVEAANTEPQRELEAAETETQKEVEAANTVPQRETETADAATQKEVATVISEPQKKAEITHNEPQKEIETVETEPQKRAEISETEPQKKAETSETEPQKKVETVHSEPLKEAETVHSEPLKEVETVHNEPLKEIETAHSEPLKDPEPAHTETQKEVETTETKLQKYILFQFADGMSCPVPNCSISRKFKQRDFIEHWKKHHNWEQIQMKEVEITQSELQKEVETTETEPQIMAERTYSEQSRDIQITHTEAQKEAERVDAEPPKESETPKTELLKEAEITFNEPQKKVETAHTEQQKEAETAGTKPQKCILFKFVDGMYCPVTNCSVSRSFVQRDFMQHWKKYHNWGQIQLMTCRKCKYNSYQHLECQNHLRSVHNGKLRRWTLYFKIDLVPKPYYIPPGMYRLKGYKHMFPPRGTERPHVQSCYQSNRSTNLGKIEVDKRKGQEHRKSDNSDSNVFSFVVEMQCPVAACVKQDPIKYLHQGRFQDHWTKVHNWGMSCQYTCKNCKQGSVFQCFQPQLCHVHLRAAHSQVSCSNIDEQFESKLVSKPWYILPGDLRLKGYDRMMVTPSHLNLDKMKTAAPSVAGTLNKKASIEDNSDHIIATGETQTQLAVQQRMNILITEEETNLKIVISDDEGTQQAENGDAMKCEDLDTEISQKPVGDVGFSKTWEKKVLKRTKLVYFTPYMTCPVQECTKTINKQWSTYLLYHSHWKKVHVGKYRRRYLCKKCAGNAPYSCFTNKSKKQHIRQHHTELKITCLDRYFQTRNERKPSYISPGAFALATSQQNSLRKAEEDNTYIGNEASGVATAGKESAGMEATGKEATVDHMSDNLGEELNVNQVIDTLGNEDVIIEEIFKAGS